jgi:hypothetical protein
VTPTDVAHESRTGCLYVKNHDPPPLHAIRLLFTHTHRALDYGDSVLSAFHDQGDTTATFGIVDMMKKSGVTKEELSNYRLLTINSWRNLKIAVDTVPIGRVRFTFCGTAELCRSSIGAGVSEYAGPILER